MRTLKITSLSLTLVLLAVGFYYFYPEPKLPAGIKIDSLVVYKSDRALLAYAEGRWVKTYKISLGKNPIGDKTVKGDLKIPEGIYSIDNKNAKSAYYKNLGISYPNKEDRSLAKKLRKSAGGDVKIHGLKNGLGFIGKFQRWQDWTEGCIALTNEEVEELYQSVDRGTKIIINP